LVDFTVVSKDCSACMFRVKTSKHDNPDDKGTTAFEATNYQHTRNNIPEDRMVSSIGVTTSKAVKTLSLNLR